LGILRKTGMASVALVITGGIMAGPGAVAALASTSRGGCFAAVADGYPPRHYPAQKTPAPCGHTLPLAQPSLPKPPQGTGASSTGALPYVSQLENPSGVTATPAPASLAHDNDKVTLQVAPAQPATPTTGSTTPGDTKPSKGHAPKLPSLNPVVKLSGLHSSGGQGHGSGSKGGTPAPRPVSPEPAPAAAHSRPAASASPSRPATSSRPANTPAAAVALPLSPAPSAPASASPPHRASAAKGTNEPMAVAGGPWPGVSLKTATTLSVPIFFAAAVGLFLLLQALVDRRDPKVSRAPERGNDETVGFQ
jgi:hypothetical protein